MKKAFILVTLITGLSSSSMAEIWKCQKVGEVAASYTDTPTGGEGINCEKVETIRFTKTGDAPKSVSAAPARSYASATKPHVVTKVKSATKASSQRTARYDEGPRKSTTSNKK